MTNHDPFFTDPNLSPEELEMALDHPEPCALTPEDDKPCRAFPHTHQHDMMAAPGAIRDHQGTVYFRLHLHPDTEHWCYLNMTTDRPENLGFGSDLFDLTHDPIAIQLADDKF